MIQFCAKLIEQRHCNKELTEFIRPGALLSSIMLRALTSRERRILQGKKLGRIHTDAVSDTTGAG
ncbi:hypothetical protein COR50_15350 [Chitinophaga caeni]|uniref:Uncharacterized protein n=1 Tax=Chitinophaga caeni TaxID=2029983 RepID=A0A291QWS8_9BACT|nr:hypothetical protein [Chitinophaga caeni]ATL48426.1 hypothetical protein COR50_15350 [Chitinophaga caeni]